MKQKVFSIVPRLRNISFLFCFLCQLIKEYKKQVSKFVIINVLEIKCLIENFNVTEIFKYTSSEIFNNQGNFNQNTLHSVHERVPFNCRSTCLCLQEGLLKKQHFFFSLPLPPPTSIPRTELNPGTAPDFLCHPLLASRKTPDIHDYIIVAFSPCPEAGSGDGRTELTLSYLYFFNYLFTNKHGQILEGKKNSKVIFKKTYIIVYQVSVFRPSQYIQDIISYK